jgi:predicted DCC family thiol-disulfide oxidoreductase YuxK
MVARPVQAPAPDEITHLVLFDGVCGLCNGLVQFLLKRDHQQVFKFAALQGATGRAVLERVGGGPSLPSSFYVVADYGSGHSRVFTKSDGVLFVAAQLRWPWRVAAVLRVLPRSLRNWLYDALARSRYRFFGRYEQCTVPSPEFQSRFVE